MKPSFSIVIFVTLNIDISFSVEYHEAKSLLRTPAFGYAAFIHHPYSKLDVNNIPLVYAGYPKQCALGCARNLTCKSFNFGTLSIFLIQNKAQYICELLQTDKYNQSSKFVDFHGQFHHYSIRSNCSKSPCLHNSTCVPNYYEDKYKCLCSKRGLIGKHCKDVDECTSNQNNCSVNANCTNTIGSYNCTCKEGYYGDGRNCTKLVFASDILQHHGNQSYLEALFGFLEPVASLNTRKWVRCWWASNDGWDVTTTFHPQCDGKAPTLTIIRKDIYVYGGYIDKPWKSSNEDLFSTKAFIFSLFNTQGYYPLKLTQRDTSDRAAYNYPNWGPTFGGGYDLMFENHAGTQPAFSSRMISYQSPPGCSHGQDNCDFFTNVAGPTTLSDAEVFYATNE